MEEYERLGFKNVKDFLNYCLAHSQKPDAKLSLREVNYLYELSGRDPPYKIVDESDIFGIHPIPYEEMKDLLGEVIKKNDLERKIKKDKDAKRGDAEIFRIWDYQ